MVKQFSHCPNCKSVNIEAQGYEFEDQTAVREMECHDCGFGWEEIYTFTQNQSAWGGVIGDDEEINISENPLTFPAD